MAREPTGVRKRLTARRCAAAGLLWVLAGCTNTLESPRTDAATQTIYLMDHGRHPSIVLPTRNGGAARYAYGDWAWFAEGRTGFLQGVSALLWPTKATLGRQQLEAWDSPEALRPQIKEGFLSLYALRVPRSAALDLAGRLDEIYAAGRNDAITNPTLSLTFVPHPDRYWALHNSNVVTARWLKAMGVEVRGTALLSRWEVAPAPMQATRRRSGKRPAR